MLLCAGKVPEVVRVGALFDRLKGSQVSNTGTTPRAIAVAAGTFYWKPAVCLFRSLELAAYSDLKIRLPGPLLDLGCGDGNVAAALRELEIIERPAVGIDILEKQVERAKARALHGEVRQADANRLPFPDESFASVFSNGVLCSIPEGPESAIAEVSRVLRPGGTFIATVPTDRFLATQLVPKLVASVSKPLARRMTAKLNRRLDHLNDYRSADAWASLMESNGLSVSTMTGFFSPTAGRAYSIVNLPVFRVFGPLRFVRSGPVKKAIEMRLAKWCIRVANRHARDTEKDGYVIIMAEKK